MYEEKVNAEQSCGTASVEAAHEKSYIEKTSGLKLPEYIGYALGDVGCCLVFGLVTSLLQKFYTDIFQLNAVFIMVMMIVARLWDAINDPIMGAIADRTKPGKSGKYRRWMLWAGMPLAISSVLMFAKWPGIGDKPDDVGTMVYATATYIMFGMSYTMAQIPYGSLANVMVSDEKERNKLSTFRSIGAGIGSMPVMIIASFCYKDMVDANGVKIIGENGKAIQEMQYLPIIIGAAVLAVGMLISYFLSYKLTRERIIPATPPKRKKGEMSKILKAYLGNRAFMAISVVSMLFLSAQMFTSSYNLYLFADFFGYGWLNLINVIATYLPIVVIMFFVQPLVNKFGKSEVSTVGMFASAAACLVMFLCKPLMPNAWWLFVILSFLNGVGQAFITIQVWSLIATAIDDVEVKTGVKESGIAYASFMFFRKIGQMIAAIAINGALLGMKYKTFKGAVQTPETLSTMYILATIIPAALFLAQALMLAFWNPLTKKAVLELQKQKEEVLKQKHENKEIILNTED
ncbi:MAG TPA: MFS transporter [Clostridiales bacterium]|nr:MFS transporter [Clostridiales bacterium]